MFKNLITSKLSKITTYLPVELELSKYNDEQNFINQKKAG